MNITANGLKIAYSTFGSGDPLLIVHGWGGTKLSMEALARQLSSKNKVYVLDLPGFGESQNPPKDWEPDQYGLVVLEFIKQLKLNNLTYVGHSFGGGIGIWLAAQNPALFNHLVLVAAAYYREPKVSGLGKFTSHIPKYSKVRELIRPIIKIYYKIFHRNSEYWKYEHLREIFSKVVTWDLRPLLSSVHTPALILWGRQDLQTPLVEGKYLHEHLPDSTFKIFENVAHNLPLAKPEEVAQEILNFIVKK